jgi:hypothetical protein
MAPEITRMWRRLLGIGILPKFYPVGNRGVHRYRHPGAADITDAVPLGCQILRQLRGDLERPADLLVRPGMANDDDSRGPAHLLAHYRLASVGTVGGSRETSASRTNPATKLVNNEQIISGVEFSRLAQLTRKIAATNQPT